jgi:hypothetical protein
MRNKERIDYLGLGCAPDVRAQAGAQARSAFRTGTRCHEMSVVRAGNLTATYVNCLPNTGLLRYGRVRVQNGRD